MVGSPCCPRDSQEPFLAPWFKSINSSALSLLYGPALTSVHDCWKKTIASTIWSFVLYLVRNLVVVVSWFSSGQSAYIIILSVLYINSVYFVKKQIKKIFSTFFFVPFTSIYCHFCGLERSVRPGAIVRVCVSRSVVPDSLRPHGLHPTRLLYP